MSSTAAARQEKRVAKEKRRLERLKKDLEAQQRKLDGEKTQLRKEKKTLDSQRRKLATDEKIFKAKLKELAARQGSSSSRRSERGGGGGGHGRKLKETEKLLHEYKLKYGDKSKQSRDYYQQIGQLEAELKVARRKLKNAEAKKGKTTTDGARSKYEREVKVLRRQLRLALKDLEKQKRYYAAQLKRFKDDQERWLAKQREASKKRGFVIKYMFLDDIRSIKIYPKRDRLRHKARITTSRGEVTTIWINNVTNFEDGLAVEDAGTEAGVTPTGDADAAMDSFLDSLEDELFPERAKKKKKRMKKLADGSLVPATPMTAEQVEEAFDFYDEEAADAKEEEDLDEDDDPWQQQSDLLSQELRDRTKDLHRVCEIYCDEPLEQMRPCLTELLKQVIARHKPWSKHVVDTGFEADEAPVLCKNWQDEIGRLPVAVKDVVAKTVEIEVGKAREEVAAAKAKAVTVPPDVEKLRKQKDAYQTSAKQLMDELSGRSKDLALLNAIYFHPDDVQLSDDDEDEVDELPEPGKTRKSRLDKLQRKLGARHTRGDSALHDLELVPEEDIVDTFASNNQTWRGLISSSSTSLDTSQADACLLQSELKERTSDFEKVVKVVSGDEPLSMLEAASVAAVERHATLKLGVIDEDRVTDEDTKDEDNDEEAEDEFVMDNEHWRQLMASLKESEDAKRKKAQESAADSDAHSDFRDEVIDDLLSEMGTRRSELLDIGSMNPTIPEECEAVYTDVATRHDDMKCKLRGKRKESLADAVTASKQEGVLERIAEENEEYMEAFQKAVRREAKAKALEEREDIWMDELNGRVNDALRVCTVAAAIKERPHDEEEIKESVASLLESVSERHKEKEKKQEEVFKSVGEDELDEKVEEHLLKYKVNDSDWRDALGSVLEGTLKPILEDAEDKDAALDEPRISLARDISQLCLDASTFDAAHALMLSTSDREPDMWWLDKDGDRVYLVDSIAMEDESEGVDELQLIGGYIATLFDSDDDPVRTLYTPQPKRDRHHIASALYDAELLNEMIALIDQNIIDARVIHKPDPFEPLPISDVKVFENAQLLYSALHALGCHLQSEDPRDWCDPKKHFEVLREIVTELHHKLLAKNVNSKRTTEFFALRRDDEEPHQFKKIKAREIMRRWMNLQLSRGSDEEVHDYSEDLYEALRKMDAVFAAGCPCEHFADDSEAAAKFLVTFAKESGVKTTVSAEDLLLPNTYSQELFASQVIGKKHGLSPLSGADKAKHGIVSKKSSKGDSFTTFVNSIVPEHLHVADLSRDLEDGIVLCYIVDKLKPKSIEWRRVKKRIKTKFDMMENCNYAMAVISKEFPFSLVGISGQDIHEGNLKFIGTLLWQMMRFWAIKKLSELSFGGKEVTDEDILQWANLTIGGLEDRRCNTIKSLRDKHLTSCIYYLELLHAILPKGAVRTELVYFDVPMLANPRAFDDFRKERLCNARYAMTLIRMHGGELFVLPEHLVALEPKAVLSVLASLMTIALTKPAKKPKPKTKDPVAEDAFDKLAALSTHAADDE